MTGPISRNRLLGSLKEAASWPGADRNTVVTLATTLVAARADAEGSQPRTPQAQPRPPARSPRLQSHPRTRGLNPRVNPARLH
jgi:hypothetical protein